MRNNSTIESLKAMRFSAMAAELERQMQDPSAYSNMGFEERLSLLVDAEWNCRQNNKLIRCIREARFAESNAVVEDIEYHEDRHLDKAQLLRFATCDFISKGHHIIFKGASGNGKTYLACALGNAACRKLMSVRYIRLPELLEELGEAVFLCPEIRAIRFRDARILKQEGPVPNAWWLYDEIWKTGEGAFEIHALLWRNDDLLELTIECRDTELVWTMEPKAE